MNAPTLFDYSRKQEAIRALEADRAKRLSSYEVQSFRRRREAALRHIPTLWLTERDKLECR